MLIEAVVGLSLSFSLGWLTNHLKTKYQSRQLPGEATIDFTFTAHPEKALKALQRDLNLLNPNSQLCVELKVKNFKGSDNKAWSKTDLPLVTGKIYGSPTEIFDTICDILLDDNSPLVKNTTNKRQKYETHPLVNKASKEKGIYLCWKDSDSPLYMKVTGVVRNTPAIDKTITSCKEEQAMIAAVREVQETTKQMANQKVKTL